MYTAGRSDLKGGQTCAREWRVFNSQMANILSMALLCVVATWPCTVKAAVVTILQTKLVTSVGNDHLSYNGEVYDWVDLAGGTSQQGKPVTLFGDIVEKLCCHPAYRLLTLRALPQMPPASIDFTTFTWPAILRRLRQMQITGAWTVLWSCCSCKCCYCAIQRRTRD